MEEMLKEATLDGEMGAVDLPVAEETKADEESVEKTRRGKGLKRGLLAFICALLFGAVVGFGITSLLLGVGNGRAKDFTVGDMTITLTEGFTKQTYPGSLAAFGSKFVEVYVGRDDLSAATKYFSEEQYASYIITHNGFADCKPQVDDGLVYFVAKQTLGGETILHYTYVYKTSEDFWLVEFVIRESAAKSRRDDISEWAHSVKFDL
jgi:hypothetical protein